jgi:lysophospholipase L1-like esterase
LGEKLRLYDQNRGRQSEGPSGHSRNWFERNPKKTIIFLVGFVVILLDLILAPFLAERIPNIKNTHYHHDFDANYCGTLTWGTKSYIIHTNSLGFKDKSNRTVKLNNNKYRILFIGDSFAEGVGFPYDETFVGLIDQQLNNLDYEVLNAGVSSYSPKLYYFKIKYLIEKVGLKFDELYVYFDISDVQDEIEYESFQPSDSYILASVNRLNFLLKRYSFTCNVAIREIIKIKRELLLKNLGAVSIPQPKNAERKKVTSNQILWENQRDYLEHRGTWTYDENTRKKWGGKGCSLAIDNMDKLYRLCQQHNIKLTIAVYPWPGEILRNNINSINISLWKEFCNKRGITFLNCYPYFINGGQPSNIVEKYYISGDIHFNLEGNKLMAQAWLDHFAKK